MDVSSKHWPVAAVPGQGSPARPPHRGIARPGHAVRRQLGIAQQHAHVAVALGAYTVHASSACARGSAISSSCRSCTDQLRSSSIACCIRTASSWWLTRRSRSLKYRGRRTPCIGLCATWMRRVLMARLQTLEKMSSLRSTVDGSTSWPRSSMYSLMSSGISGANGLLIHFIEGSGARMVLPTARRLPILARLACGLRWAVSTAARSSRGGPASSSRPLMR